MPDYGIDWRYAVARIKINNVTMPPIKSMSIEDEPIWSSKTGRTASGAMKGDIVAHKDKVSVTFAPMSSEMADKLKSAIHQAFFNLTYESVSGKTRTAKFYASAPKYTVYSYAEKYKNIKYVDVSVDFIEQ